MEGGSVLGTLLAGGILLFLGSLITFAGYRLFLILLPIYGFFFGLSFGAHSVQALFGDGFLSTTTSWVVGFFAGLLFALLSYLFWVFAVALLAGSLGYALVAGFFSLFGADLDVLVWIVGVAGRHRLRDRRGGAEPPEGHRDRRHGPPGRLDGRGDVPVPVHVRHTAEHRGERREDGARRPPALVPDLRRGGGAGDDLPVPGQPRL